MSEKTARFSIKRAGIAALRARYFLPGTSASEKVRIEEELVRRKQRAKKERSKGKRPTASISNIYDKKKTRSVSGKPLQGGRGS